MTGLLTPRWGAIDILGIIVAAEHVPAFLALVGVLGAAAIAAIPVVMKHRADKKASVVTEFRALYEAMRDERAKDAAEWEKKFKSQGEQLVELQREMKEIQLQKELDRHTISRQNDRIRDLVEENEDLWGFAHAIIRWEEAGGTPPLPTRPWRIQDSLGQAHADGLL